MKFCPSCGVELKPGARFCGSCGTPLQIDQPQSTANQPSQQAIPNHPPEPTQNPYQQSYQQQGYQQANSQQSYQQPYQQPFYGVTSSNSGLVSRVINIMTKPKKEWENVSNEMPVTQKLLTYAIILVLIPAICNFIAYGFIGVKMMGYTFKSPSMGLQQALTSFIGGFISVYLTAYVVNMLATSFDSVKDFGRSLQLVVYSMTPFWVAGILFLIPGFQTIVYLFGIYAIVILYKGMPIVMRTPQHKAAGYLIVSIIILIVVQAIVVLILGVILGVFFATRMGAF
ncbi:MAG: YIP1 family protein [Bacteroidetes bacterium]|nr:YIP1 family protein [Bacteroidota bacterium]